MLSSGDSDVCATEIDHAYVSPQGQWPEGICMHPAGTEQDRDELRRRRPARAHVENLWSMCASSI
jgi:hypothetical protein